MLRVQGLNGLCWVTGAIGTAESCSAACSSYGVAVTILKDYMWVRFTKYIDFMVCLNNNLCMQVTGLAVSDRHPYMFSAGLDKMVKCWDMEYNKVMPVALSLSCGINYIMLHCMPSQSA